MKLDPVYFLLSVAIGLVLSYGLWSAAGELATFIAVGSIFFLCSTLGMTLGIRHENSRTQSNLSSLSGVFFVVGLCVNVLFCFVGNLQVAYMLTSALCFLIYLLLFTFIQRTR